MVEVGVRQAWPFFGLAHRDHDDEVRPYLDADFSVLPGWPDLNQHPEDALAALSEITMQTVSTSVEDEGGLVIDFETGRLTVNGAANELTTGAVWWFARQGPGASLE